MSKFFSLIKKSYVLIILVLFYIPIIFATVFSFNQTSKKGDLSFTNWNGFSWNSWKELGSKDVVDSFLNSLIIGVSVSFIVIVISLLTVFALWRQKNKVYKSAVDSSANISLINPDIITAIALSIGFSTMFGLLSIENDGLIRVIISHSVVIIPYALILLYPRSEKFPKSLLEASKDLGYGPIRAWISSYLRFMLPALVGAFIVSMVLSFDDFILTRTTSNITKTLGVKLYEGKFHGWALAIGSIILILSIIIGTIFALIRRRKYEKVKKA